MNLARARRWLVAALVAGGVAAPAALAFADPPRAPAGAARDDAASRFDEGVRAFSVGDYRVAGRMFEAAYALAPHHDALWNAGQAWERAGDPVRAANLLERFLAEAPPDARDRDAATRSLNELGPRLGRFEIHPGAGIVDILVDGERARPVVYVPPGSHVIEGRSRSQSVRQTLTLSAGEVRSVILELDATAPAPDAPRAANGRPLSPWFVAAGAALTAGLGIATVASGLATDDAHDAYEQAPTLDRLEDGRDQQSFTNGLFWGTVAVGALTAATAIWLVQWKKPAPRGFTSGFRVDF